MAWVRLLHWLLVKGAVQICSFSPGYKTCLRERFLEEWDLFTEFTLFLYGGTPELFLFYKLKLGQNCSK